MFTGKVTDAYIDFVFRSRGTFDALSKIYAFRKSLEQQASVIAFPMVPRLRQPLSGNQPCGIRCALLRFRRSASLGLHMNNIWNHLALFQSL